MSLRILSLPFLSFDLFQHAIQQLSDARAFTGKYPQSVSVMAAVFQEVAKVLQNEEVGRLPHSISCTTHQPPQSVRYVRPPLKWRSGIGEGVRYAS